MVSMNLGKNNVSFLSCLLAIYLKQVLRNPRNCPDQRYQIRFWKGIWVFSTYIRPGERDFGAFSRSFQVQVRTPGSGGSNFKSPRWHPETYIRVLSSMSWVEWCNIFQIWSSYHKLQLKTVQKCQKYGVLDRKVNFSHLFLDITSQLFHTIIYESCSFYSCKKIRNRIRPIDRKNGPKLDLKIWSFRIFELDPQIIYHSIELVKLSNFCEDTTWLSIMICAVWRFEWIIPTKMTKIFKNS